MGTSEPKLEAQQKRVNISDVLSKTTLNLLEFLVLEKAEKLYSLTDLSIILGVSLSTVSKICRKLIKWDILVERTYPKSHVGRPITIIELNDRQSSVRDMRKWVKNFSDFLNGERKTDNTY